MVLTEDIITTRGVLLIARGQEVNAAMKLRLSALSRRGEIREPIGVRRPAVPDHHEG
jgi:hypothetical protein